jgi:hypothetical protein
MTREELLDDLAYARNLAEEGRHAPLIGGAFLVLFGALLAIAWTTHWAAITGQFGAWLSLNPGLVWVGFGVAAGVGGPWVSASVRKKAGGTAIGNRTDRAVWQAGSGAIFAVVVGTLLAAILRGEHHAPDAIMAASFGFYGIALSTTAAIAGIRWLGGFSLLAFGFSGVLWAFNSEPWAYLLAAFAAVLVLIVPGIIIMRQEPSDIV